jgi:hypothetical protein
MDFFIPLANDLFLKASDGLIDRQKYATSSLPKGLVLVSNGTELIEEAVGFGFPVLMRGLQSLFPGQVELTVEHKESVWSVQAVFILDRIEKIQRLDAGSVENKLVYTTKNAFAYLIRQLPPLRKILTTASSGLRRTLGWKTTYEHAGVQARVKIVHTLQEMAGKGSVEIQLLEIPPGTTEAIVMNEQGATYFNSYQDSDGLSLKGEKIGCWDEVIASEACFSSLEQHVAFKLGRVEGARLFRGRELVGSRLVWAGFGYSFPPITKEFRYQLGIEKLP